MTKYTAIGCAVLVSCFGLYLLIHGYGDAKFQEGFKSAIAAQAQTDNAALIDSAQKMVSAYEQTQEGLKELAQVDDKTLAGPAITVALDRLHTTRKPSRSGPTATATP